MDRYKNPNGNRLIRALTKNGYEIKKYCKGSHVFLIHPENKNSYAVVPNIKKPLKTGTLEGIRKDQLKISKNKFFEILEDS